MKVKLIFEIINANDSTSVFIRLFHNQLTQQCEYKQFCSLISLTILLWLVLTAERECADVQLMVLLKSCDDITINALHGTTTCQML